MSSILIKGMKMPNEDELLCIRIYPSGKVTVDMDLQCKQVAEAVGLSNHGDLIDRDVLRKDLRMGSDCKKCIHDGGLCMLDTQMMAVCAKIGSSPTVIPAERSGE